MIRYLPVFLCFLLVLTGLQAHAQTAITKQMANSFYKQCKTKDAPDFFSVQSRDMMCSCIAAHMQQKMSVEDIRAMSIGGQGPGRAALNKVIIEVYAPCMEAPTADYHYDQCINDPEIKQNKQKTCDCLSNEVSVYVRDNGPAVFQDIMSRNPDIFDPMSALFNDQKFMAFANTKLTACYNRY